jgi:hypothetical protein
VEDKLVLSYENTIRHVVGYEVQEFSNTPYGEFRILNSPFAEINNNSEDGDFYAKDESIANYSGNDITPDNQSHKVSQRATAINLIHAVAKHIDAQEVSEIYLGICVPVAEIYQAAGKAFKHKLQGTYTVEFPRLQRSVNFSLVENNVYLQGEGIVAFASYVEERDMIKRMANRTVLVVDAGYRSTELILVKKMVPYTYTATSPELGGISIEAEVGAQLHKQGILNGDVRALVRSGELRTQDGKIMAGKIVRMAKSLLAHNLASHVKAMTTRTKEVGNVNNITDIFATGRCFAVAGKEAGHTGNLLDELNNALGLQAELHRSDSLGDANVLSTFKMLQRAVTKRQQ